MMDLSDKGSDCETATTPTSDSSSSMKSCVDCGTSKTPLWRGGPAGPKSLCNACGIRSRKKRRALLGITKDKKKKTTKTSDDSSSSNSCTSSTGDSTLEKVRDPLNQKLWALALQRRTIGRDEEQAAFLLMALSCGCGSVYA